MMMMMITIIVIMITITTTAIIVIVVVVVILCNVVDHHNNNKYMTPQVYELFLHAVVLIRYFCVNLDTLYCYIGKQKRISECIK